MGHLRRTFPEVTRLFDPFGSSDASITDFLAEESLREDKVFGRRNWPVQALRSAFG
ncbi:MAG: hypothetical protein ACI8QS_003573, partial [Planctomycetota bacterium]